MAEADYYATTHNAGGGSNPYIANVTTVTSELPLKFLMN